MLQLATTDKEKLRQEALVKENQYPEALIHAVESSQASKIAGQNTPHSGLYIPDAGWVSPVRLCNYLLQHPDIHCRFNTRVDKISRTGDNWHLYDNNDQLIASSAIVVVAGASETKRFEQLSHLPVKPIRGQVSLKQATSEAPVLNTVICGEGYISPPLDNQWCFGASFDVKTPSDEIRAEDHQSNFKNFRMYYRNWQNTSRLKRRVPLVA